MKLSLIAGIARNGVIGKENSLPWRIPEDLQRFKSTTLGNSIVMGRKTFESIGRPLPGRHNIVLSRSSTEAIPGVLRALSIDQAIALANSLPSRNQEIFVIGGAEIYAAALPRVERIYLTRIDHDFIGDALFPQVPWNQFYEVSREDREGDPPFSFHVYERTPR